MRSEQGGSAEPMLIAWPTQCESGLVFPLAVVEGKDYSTGKQASEASNQAAVSGAGGLKIQLDLSEQAKRATTSFSIPPTPLVFYVYAKGRYHELWAHNTGDLYWGAAG